MQAPVEINQCDFSLGDATVMRDGRQQEVPSTSANVRVIFGFDPNALRTRISKENELVE